MPSTLAALPSRVASLPREMAERDRFALRDRNEPWRAWYKTARWQRLRSEVLTRDLWTCQRTGLLLAGKYPADDSAVVDHIRPHRGDPKLFWDIDNLQALSKGYHDSQKQREEAAERVTGG